MNRIVILQPSYLPWIGYFDQILKSDTFIFLDDVLYTKNDWRNRNKIKTPSGTLWLSLPVEDKDRIKNKLLIKDIKIKNKNELIKHLNIIGMNYKKAKYYSEFYPLLKSFIERDWELLSDFNIRFVYLILEYLNIKKKFFKTSELKLHDYAKTERLIEICKYFKATNYLTGDSAINYLEKDEFIKNGIKLEFQNYKHPTYNQLWGEFIPYLSIIDLLFNHGQNSKNIILNINENK